MAFLFGGLQPKRHKSLGIAPLVGIALVAALTLGMQDRWGELASDVGVQIPTGFPIIGTARVIDGDTISVDGVRIRLHGIDAVERDQFCGSGADAWPCGQRAKEALEMWVGSSQIVCLPRDIDRYNRTVAECQREAENMNEWLVREGWAVADLRYSDKFHAAEIAARESGRGIFGGSFMLPALWRSENREGRGQ